MLRILLLVIALAASLPAHAETLLWRTLAEGDSPESAKAKLEAMAEVKRVKIKKKRGGVVLDINMKDGGIPIFEGHFSVETAFENDRLVKVNLASGAGCLDDAYPFALNLRHELEKKYPEVVNPFPDRSRFMIEALDATSSRVVEVSGGYLGDDVGVLMRSLIVQVDPPAYVGGSALNRSLYQIARSTYDIGAAKCGGAYYRKAQFILTYVSRETWEAVEDRVSDEVEAERQSAADNL